MRPDTELLADSGYQGLAKLHAKSRTPHKRWRKTIPLTEAQRAHNTALASERVLVENVIRRLKVFRLLKETYRHRRRRHGLRVHLLAGLYNHDLLIGKITSVRGLLNLTSPPSTRTAVRGPIRHPSRISPPMASRSRT